MGKAKKILIYSDNAQINELYGAAKAIGEEVVSFYIGKREDAAGAETLYYLGDTENGKLYESYLPAVIKLVEEVAPDVVLFSTSVRCRLMAAVVAGKFHTSVLTDASDLCFEETLSSKRMVYGGSAVRLEKSKGMAVVCLPAGSYEAEELPASNIIDVQPVCADGIVRTGVQKKVKETVNLAAAKRVVCVGRGCSGEAAMKAAQEFAQITESEMGCTRPVSEDGLMSAAQYVGISGVMMKPDVYFGFGISGQIQHVVGVNTAKVMFVINKDKNAPFFKNADYGLVANTEAVLPKINELLR